jgi:hypothetical protein
MTSSQESSSNARSAVFTDLDPFGSSKPRPYFDRKDLFATEVKSTSRQDSGSGPSSLTSNPPLPDFSKSNGTQSKPNPAAVSSQVDDPDCRIRFYLKIPETIQHWFCTPGLPDGFFSNQ